MRVLFPAFPKGSSIIVVYTYRVFWGFKYTIMILGPFGLREAYLDPIKPTLFRDPYNDFLI